MPDPVKCARAFTIKNNKQFVRAKDALSKMMNKACASKILLIIACIQGYIGQMGTRWVRKKYHRPLKNHYNKSRRIMVKSVLCFWSTVKRWYCLKIPISRYERLNTIPKNLPLQGCAFFVMIFQRSVVLLSDSPCTCRSYNGYPHPHINVHYPIMGNSINLQ